MAALLFAAASIFFVWLFVNRLISEREIRTGVFTYSLITGITAAGLWMQRQWGRSVALLISLASAGLGTLALLSVILSREGSLIAPAITFVASVAFAFWLSRPVFVRSDE